ncbi:ABC transporter ATP-binding protein [Brevibacillus dissolubilis]|uniref:ABC transporter ATP-binding protein n=1 Tax=Brevibacillus dissolubilis TaxID=1844116 RepID=UPI00159B953A|nr:ABC transporter ATP-binding protein [Brevibacillus dissolubilis]
MAKQVPAIELINVTKQAGNHKLIDSLTLAVNRGEIFGLLGPSGSGKTTLFQLITGLTEPTRGQVLINGLDLHKHFRRAISQVGAVIDNPQLYPFLTGYQNLLHFARMTPGLRYDRASLHALLSRVGLDKAIHTKAAEYTLGMSSRLALAQALLHKPSILLLDEPTAGLDATAVRELGDLLRDLTDRDQVTVLVTSHLLAEMELLCDRIGVMQMGRLVTVKTTPGLDESELALSNVFIEVDLLEEAKKLLSTHYPQANIVDCCPMLELGVVMRKEIPAITEILVQSGIKVYGIQAATKKLGDRFRELKGSGT